MPDNPYSHPYNAEALKGWLNFATPSIANSTLNNIPITNKQLAAQNFSNANGDFQKIDTRLSQHLEEAFKDAVPAIGILIQKSVEKAEIGRVITRDLHDALNNFNVGGVSVNRLTALQREAQRFDNKKVAEDKYRDWRYANSEINRQVHGLIGGYIKSRWDQYGSAAETWKESNHFSRYAAGTSIGLMTAAAASTGPNLMGTVTANLQLALAEVGSNRDFIQRIVSFTSSIKSLGRAYANAGPAVQKTANDLLVFGAVGGTFMMAIGKLAPMFGGTFKGVMGSAWTGAGLAGIGAVGMMAGDNSGASSMALSSGVGQLAALRYGTPVGVAVGAATWLGTGFTSSQNPGFSAQVRAGSYQMSASERVGYAANLPMFQQQYRGGTFNGMADPFYQYGIDSQTGVWFADRDEAGRRAAQMRAFASTSAQNSIIANMQVRQGYNNNLNFGTATRARTNAMLDLGFTQENIEVAAMRSGIDLSAGRNSDEDIRRFAEHLAQRPTAAGTSVRELERDLYGNLNFQSRQFGVDGGQLHDFVQQQAVRDPLQQQTYETLIRTLEGLEQALQEARNLENQQRNGWQGYAQGAAQGGFMGAGS